MPPIRTGQTPDPMVGVEDLWATQESTPKQGSLTPLNDWEPHHASGALPHLRDSPLTDLLPGCEEFASRQGSSTDYEHPDSQPDSEAFTSRVLPERSLSPLTELEDDDIEPAVVKKTRSSRKSKTAPYSSSHSGRATQKLSKPEPITVNGIVLQPTLAFDTFWRWCAERLSIDQRRRDGQPFPWTDDPTLQTKFFCNTFRVLDKTSQFIITEVIEKGEQTTEEIVFRVLLFCIFTKIETWKWLVKQLGAITWKSFRTADYVTALKKRIRAGHTLYTGSYQKPGPRWEKSTWQNHIQLLEVFMGDGIPSKLHECTSLADAYVLLAAYPGMGSFNAFQLLLNLSYSSVLNFSGKDFVVPGIGAKSGLYKLFGASIEKAAKRNPDFRVAVLRYMMDTQDFHFHRLGLKFSGLGPDKLAMELADIEHAVCELDKYAREVHPEIQGLYGRTKLRKSFVPSQDPYPASPVLPKAWSHPQRQVVHACNKIPKVVERYTVYKLTSHRYHPSKGLEFNVRWLNYSPEDDTWEPVDKLLEDAPDVVNSYWEKHTGRRYIDASSQ